MAKISAMLNDTSTRPNLGERICQIGIKLLGADGVSLALTFGNVLNSEINSDREYAFLDEQQFTYAEGPTYDARKSAEPVSAKNFESNAEKTRWPIFSPIALDRGVHSMVAFPLRVGNTNLGVLSAYRKNTNQLLSNEFIDGLTLSSLAGSFLIQEMTNNDSKNSDSIIDAINQDQSIIHLASGVIAEKFNLSIVEALVRLRAYAYRKDLPLLTVATEIAEGNMKFTDWEK
jgi:hypothetical protein